MPRKFLLFSRSWLRCVSLRPAKSSSESRRKLYPGESEAGGPGLQIEYLDLEFPVERGLLEDHYDEREASRAGSLSGERGEEVVYRNIDFVKTNAFNQTREVREAMRRNMSTSLSPK